MTTRKAELDEIKASLKIMADEISKVATQQQSLLSLMEEIQKLRETVNLKDKKIEELEIRIDSLEQQSRSKDLIITGLDTKHRSYARVTAGGDEGEDAPPEEMQSLELQVHQYLSSKDINLETNSISSCYKLPNKNRNIKPMIVVQMVSQKQKSEVLRQTRKLKGTGIYINEHLTKKNAEIARWGRTLRKQNKIMATWTRNGKVYIRPNGEENNRPVIIKTLKELDNYK